MSREIDRRDFSVNKVTPARAATLTTLAADVSDNLPGEHRIRITSFDPVTGNPATIVSDAAPAETGDFIQRALSHMRGIHRVLSLEATQPSEYLADPHYQTTTSGAVAVHLQQQHKGIPIFQAAETVRFTPGGALQETAGSNITITRDWEVAPKLTAQQAVENAAKHVAVPAEDEQGATDPFGEPLPVESVDLTGFAPRVSATFTDQPGLPTVLEAGPFGDQIKASLIWFPLGEELRLAWEVILTMPAYTGQYRVLVDSQDGEILYCKQLMRSMIGRGMVYQVDGGSARQMVDFPRPWVDYGLPIPNGFPLPNPDEWVEADSTLGNCTFAHLGESGPTLRGQLQAGALSFNPADPNGDDQKILNIFYYNCFMHDYFYLLGFREVDGNFQQNNFGRGGTPSDRVDARAHSGAVWGTANMATPVDGSRPVMNMGLVTSTNRHTAFDSTVVFHEFMHGVTNRLVGGPMNSRALDEPQSGGMGEGWGDYVACMLTQSDVVGAWVVNRSSGIRAFRYDSNFPDHFGMLGTGRYSEVHNIGEIWCATLMETSRQVDSSLAMQLVVDALKLSPANPSFLDMRDTILAALDHKQAAGQLSQGETSTARNGIWAAFAKFGMGSAARTNGASLSGIVADFNPPPPEAGEVSLQLQATPGLTIPDNQSAGVSNQLMIAQPGQITRLAVSVDIEHSFIGDLQVTLVAPDSRSALLHNRSGASADDLIKTYTHQDTPALAAFVGGQAVGDWTLRVADRAWRDIGTLRAWSLEVGIVSAPLVVRVEASPGLPIPDNDPGGISSTLAVAQAGAAQDIQVGVDITHTYIGDLRVELVSPSGNTAVLHNRAGGSRDNLITTFEAAATPALGPVLGQPIQGNWVLRVTDLAGRDIGKLNSWYLELTT